MLISINPFTEEQVFNIEELTQEGIAQHLELAGKAFANWKATTIKERCHKLKVLAELLCKRKTELATAITKEMGKPIVQSEAEIEKCAWLCDYYAVESESHLKINPIETDAFESYVRYDPLGVILGVMPWNYPFWQVFRFAVPTLTAGNGAILKHASNVSLCGILIQQLFLDAGYPVGIFQFFPIQSNKVNVVLEHPVIKGVSLTGSTPAGSAVAAKAGSLIKKSVLELGGNNALVVFEDADIQRVLDICIQARFQNTGQSCIAGKRLLLQEAIAKNFLEGLKAKVESLISGDPEDRNTFIGVMARESLAADLELQLIKSLAMGAKLVCGGQRKGTYFQPTIVGNARPGMPIFDEETFGPLLAVTQFRDEQDAVQLVSQSEFGLGVSIFTNSEARIHRLIPQMDEGAVFINELVKSDPRLPFGGVKISGYGRELSLEGIQEFVNRKTVYKVKF
jgi:succinate-semialdehyde dehydrogenase / glutarate-semialdehyde dehydrogenase